MKKKNIFKLNSVVLVFLLAACNSSSSTFESSDVEANNENSEEGVIIAETKESLGEKLFKDSELSRNGNQSCATCHNPDHAFIDDRINASSVDTTTPGAVSLGQDDLSLGDRNTPTAAYAAFGPDFHFNQEEGLFMGGQFLDGREPDLQGQAGQPFLNPVEMQTTKADVVSKVENKYGDAMRHLYGEQIFDTVDSAYDAITESIGAFEETDVFAPFDSKFDKVLQGEAAFTEEEQQGFVLYVLKRKGNCAACHPVPTALSEEHESVFTDFTYDNLGVPVNHLARSVNGKEKDFVDNGLFDNPAVDDPSLKGAFRVTGLRNMAVTGPYMHNGVFKDLKTVVHFYNTRDVDGAINPETGEEWQPSEVEVTKNTEELGNLGLTDAEEDAIVAFLKTLTDSRYEHLIP